MTDPQQCDIVVVGAGPAGATTAFLLARAGYRVRLIDKRTFPRSKLCAGLLTWKTIDLLNQLFGETSETLKTQKIITHACRDYQIYFGSKEIARGRMDFPFHFVQRSTYDHHWLKLAEAAGAQVHTGVAVHRVKPEKGLVITADGRSFQAGIIIGADGVWSTVRKSFPSDDNFARYRRHLAAGVETFHAYTTKPTAHRNVAALHFGFLPWGYAWDFPGSDRRTLGMAGLTQKNGSSFLNTFRDFLSGLEMRSTALEDFRGYPLPYGNFIVKPVHKKALLVGDACGLADPLLGEGIYYAHRSAQLAARAIVAKGLEPNAVGKAYQADLRKKVIRELRWILFFRISLFIGGRRRRYRGLKIFFRLFPKRLEACVQGQRSFSRLLLP